jgi:hypothetical protein
LNSLEDKIKKLEHGEGEKSVYFQSIAKKLKDENEKLRNENIALKRKLMALEDESHEEGRDFKKRDTLSEEELEEIFQNKIENSQQSDCSQFEPSIPPPPSDLYDLATAVSAATVSMSPISLVDDINPSSETCGFCTTSSDCLCSQILIDDISKVETEFSKPGTSQINAVDSSKDQLKVNETDPVVETVKLNKKQKGDASDGANVLWPTTESQEIYTNGESPKGGDVGTKGESSDRSDHCEYHFILSHSGTT